MMIRHPKHASEVVTGLLVRVDTTTSKGINVIGKSRLFTQSKDINEWMAPES